MSRNTRIIPNPDAALKSAMSKALAAELARRGLQPWRIEARLAALNAREAITMGISGRASNTSLKMGVMTVGWRPPSRKTSLGNFFF